jgi:hypothetical protein
MRRYIPSGTQRVQLRKRRSEIAARLAAFGRAAAAIPKMAHAVYLRETEWRYRLVVTLFALSFLTLAGRGYYLATSPFIRTKANLVVLNTEQSSVAALVSQTEQLRLLTNNVERASLADIRAALEKTVTVANRAALDFQGQFEAWSELRGKIKQDSSTYDALRAQLSDLQKLQQGEILRLKEALDAAQKPSIFADVFNLSLSFVLGVLSSILASALYEGWRRRRLGTN